MTDERLECLGNYFVHFKVLERFGITFQQFLKMVELDTWKEMVA